jgi:hemerythrin superfamily protein
MKKILQKHVGDLYDISAPLQRLIKMLVFSPDFEETDLFPRIEEFSIGLEEVEETLDIIDAEVADVNSR